jgi:predicted methyltransferase
MTDQLFITRILACSKKNDVKPGIVLELFRFIYIHNCVLTMQELGRSFALPKVNLGRILSFFQDFFAPKSRYIHLKTSTKQFLNIFFNHGNCDIIINAEQYQQDLEQIYTTIERNNYHVKRKYDQFLATIDTMIRRGLLLISKFDIWQRNILFLGDDDLTSIAVALTRQAQKITVIDIDPDILSIIDKAATKYKFSIQTIMSDLRQTNLKQFKQQYDVVFTDPPYTQGGIELFLTQAINLLKKRNSSSLYFCYGNSERAREKILEIQKLILEKQLVITSLISHFNRYYGAYSIGGNSDLYHCSIAQSTPVQQLNKAQGNKIYTNQ